MDAQDTTSFVSCIHIALRDSMNHLMYFIFSFTLIFINSLFSFFFFLNFSLADSIIFRKLLQYLFLVPSALEIEFSYLESFT